MTAEHKAGAQPGKASSARRARAVVSPWAAPSAREQQREAKRNAVLTTAARMFNERGFHATSLDDIAASLNVTKPTLYYYVKNKDEILLACVNKGLRMTLDGIEASRQAGGNALDQLRACMQVYAEIVVQPFGMCLIRVGDEEVPEPSRTEPGVSPPGGAGRAGRLDRAVRPQDHGLRHRRGAELDRALVPARGQLQRAAGDRAVPGGAARRGAHTSV